MGKPPSDEEIALFRRSVGPVRPVRHDRIVAQRRRPSARPRRALQPQRPADFPGFTDNDYSEPVAAEEMLAFARPGLQHRLLSRLRRGQFAIGAELDLHGMTAAVAHHAVTEFIAQCTAQRIRCVRMIHGKGHGAGGAPPVIKSRLNHWLRAHPDVLAFNSATASEGGAGALYVLLRSRREQR